MLDSIINYRIKDLHKLTTEQAHAYGKVLKFLRPIPKLGRYKARDLYELEFAEVENIKNFISSSDKMIDAMEIFYKCPKWFLVRYRLVAYTHAQNYMIQKVEELLAREKKVLSGVPDTDMIEAGVERLNVFGPLNVLDRLGKDFGKSPTEVETWSYGLVFGLMWKRTVRAEIDERYQDIQKSKNN